MPSGQVNFGSGLLIGIPKKDSTGAAIANATPVVFGELQDIAVEMSFEEKLLYGKKKFPIAYGQGKGKISVKAKTATIRGAVFGDLFFGSGTTAGIRDNAIEESHTVAGVGHTVTIAPPNSGDFVSDLGVYNASTGTWMQRVASSPAAGQYSVDDTTGVYTFHSGAADQIVKISYEYFATSTSGRYGVITNENMGYAPTVKLYLTQQYAGNGMNLVFNQCTSSKLGLQFKNDDFTIPEIDFSIFADENDEVGYWSTTE